ncbi:hypothetical protein JCM6882_004767 [Rhodosporidiobolus microsporus]
MKRSFDDDGDSSAAAQPESFGGWTPAPGESPAEREKRLKREKRARQLGQDPLAASSFPSSTHSNAAPAAPLPTTTRSATEDYGGWKPAEGESPAEREKRLKREKRAAKLAAEGGAGGYAGAGEYGAPPPPQARVQELSGARSAKEEYGGWKPLEGESPAEREKRLKREKRAAIFAAQGQGQGQGGAFPPPAGGYDAPPHASTSGGFSLGDALLSASADQDAAAQQQQQAEEQKKSKHRQSKTPARMKYLERKKKVRKAKKKAAPSSSSAAAAAGKSGDAAAEEEEGEGEGTPAPSTAAAAAAVAGEKRKRADDDDRDDDEDEDASAAQGGKNLAHLTPEQRWPDLSPPEREAKLALIAQKKLERREQRLARKAEAKRVKAAGGAVEPPKARVRVVEGTKKRLNVAAERERREREERERREEEERRRGVEEGVVEPTEEEVEERKRREEIEERKRVKAEKKAQRRAPPVESAPAADAVDEDGDAPMLIPTAPPPSAPSPSAPPLAAEPPRPRSPSPSPQPLLRLPSSTRPAPPSVATLSALKVHEQVRGKVVVDPVRKVVLEEGDGVDVSERGRKRLRGEMGVEEWFAVQTAVLPLLLPSPPSSSQTSSLYPPLPPRDLLVSAPTGSGKTLSYVVPLVEVLARRTVTRLRALVLLPTRDLVGQVRETFEAFGKGTGLKIGVATGQHSFAHEQTVLVGPPSSLPSDLKGGHSQVDILIATPGRLMDHLKSTPGFSLQHLRFLVVDEADRLLTQSFHEWLPTVLAALKPSSSLPSSSGREGEKENVPVSATAAASTNLEQDRLKLADPMAPLWWDASEAEGGVGRVGAEGEERSFGSCQKLLFSATLSRDPAKIDALHLHRPIYISVEDALQPHAEDDAFVSSTTAPGADVDVDAEKRFTFPAELSEHMIVSPAAYKPLYLLHLLHHPDAAQRIEAALCFTKSVEAATRLAKLVELVEAERGEVEGEKKVVVRAFSSELAPGERKRVLKEFKEGKITMLIASDLISRGIDLPSVSHVVSYDIPSDMRKYVHRVGRTARAGKKGDAWSLVEEQEVAPFRSIMTSAQHYDKIARVRVKDKAVEPFVPAYQVALEKLKLFFATGGAKERLAVGQA